MERTFGKDRDKGILQNVIAPTKFAMSFRGTSDCTMVKPATR
jgi:hypothetical protein